eukprot:10857663-Ditylum_brightwellii.AAC.1
MILYSLKYTLTTAFGERPQQNWHKFLAAVFGIRQGSTDGPSGWLFISKLILKCYTRLARGFVIKDPGKDVSVPGHADMFVDDNTLMHNTPTRDATAPDLMQNVQHDAELWGQLLWVTGGLLEFLKSSYFL